MGDLKTLVRIIIALICFYGVVHGQTLNRRQQLNLQRQQKQLNEQQEHLEKQLLSQADIFPSTFSSRDQTQLPINHAILDSIFNVPIQAIRAVNELLKALAVVRARLHPKAQTTASPDLIETFE